MMQMAEGKRKSKIGQGFIVSYLIKEKIKEWYPKHEFLGCELELGVGHIPDLVLFSARAEKRFILVEVTDKIITGTRMDIKRFYDGIIDRFTHLRRGLSFVFDVPYHRVKYCIVFTPNMRANIQPLIDRGVDVKIVEPEEVRSYFRKMGLELHLGYQPM